MLIAQIPSKNAIVFTFIQQDADKLPSILQVKIKKITYGLFHPYTHASLNPSSSASLSTCQLFLSITLSQELYYFYISFVQSPLYYKCSPQNSLIYIIITKNTKMQVTLRPMQANLNRDTDWFGRMDPYVKLMIGGQMFRSSVCQSGGKHPHWNDSFNCTLQGDANLRVQVWDDDGHTHDDSVGTGQVNLMQYLNQGGNTTIWVDVFHRNRNVGRVCIGMQMMGGMGGMGMNQNCGYGNQMGQRGGYGGGYNQGGYNNGGMNPMNGGGFGGNNWMMNPNNNGW